MVIICKECNEPNGHKCGCSVGIERAAHLMTIYHQGQYRAWEVAEVERIHLDDIAEGQRIANKRMEDHRLNVIAYGSPEYGYSESARASMKADRLREEGL